MSTVLTLASGTSSVIGHSTSTLIINSASGVSAGTVLASGTTQVIDHSTGSIVLHEDFTPEQGMLLLLGGGFLLLQDGNQLLLQG